MLRRSDPKRNAKVIIYRRRRRESVHGTSRHFRCVAEFGRYRGHSGLCVAAMLDWRNHRIENAHGPTIDGEFQTETQAGACVSILCPKDLLTTATSPGGRSLRRSISYRLNIQPLRAANLDCTMIL